MSLDVVLVLRGNPESNKDVRVGRKRYTEDEIIWMLREAEGALSRGQKVREVCRSLDIALQAHY